MSSLVSYRLDDGVATITMDDGKVNVLSLAMFEAVNRALDQAETDAAAVVLAGRPNVFSAGFDLRVLMAGGPDAARLILTGFRLGHRLLSFPAPVVAACAGNARAMGVFLLLASDYRLGAVGDYTLQANEVAIGITMPYFAIEICRQRLTPAHFNRAVIHSESYAPDAGVAAGFLDRLAPAAELADAARATAASLAALNRPAFTATKLRARAASLEAVQAAIAADEASFQALA